MSAISDIRLAAQSSGIATLADARDVLERSDILVSKALLVLSQGGGIAFDVDVDDAQDGDAATLRGSLQSLCNQAIAYAARVRDDIGDGDGPIDAHTRERVVAALAIAKGAFERVQDAVNDPGLQMDFTGAAMEGVKIAASGVNGIARAVGAGAVQAVISLWWIALPVAAILAWLIWRKVRRAAS